MKIFLATWILEPSQGQTLTNIGGGRRLLSYFHTKQKVEVFSNYCRKGTNEDIPSRKRSDAK